MKRAYICTVGLLALVLMAASARAGNVNIPLVQTAQPITRAYPGVKTDVLGIKIGMAASQAEAIANGIYGKKPPNAFPLLSFGDNGTAINSQPFVNHELFVNCTAQKCDSLALNFTSPVTGNALYRAFRKINFDEDHDSKLFPPIDAIKASLIKKYGPPSYQQEYGPQTGEHKSPYGEIVIAWVFSKDSRITCTSYDCIGAASIQGDSWDLSDPVWSSQNFPTFTRQYFQKRCGISAGSPAVFKILATIDASGKNASTARKVTVAIWDPQACVNDGVQLTKQLEMTAAKFPKAGANAAPKAAPKAQAGLPGASESLPPGSGPLSFYSDMGNVIGSQSPRAVHPATLMLTENGSVALVDLQWSSWGKGIARATGVWTANDCTPNCAAGKQMKIPTQLTLWSPGLVAGHWVYRCFQIDPRHPKQDILDRACIQGEEYDALPQ